jgi:hypothetical protein
VNRADQEGVLQQVLEKLAAPPKRMACEIGQAE